MLQHRIPVLWCFHKVHHSAPVMTPLTAYRSHPVDDLVEGVDRLSCSSACATACSCSLFDPDHLGRSPSPARMPSSLIGFAGLANLRHSHTWISWGDRLEQRSSVARHNIRSITAPIRAITIATSAGCLSLWDWLFGTLITARTRQTDHVRPRSRVGPLSHRCATCTSRRSARQASGGSRRGCAGLPRRAAARPAADELVRV